MKFQKLFVSVVTACLMLGASNAAMALGCLTGVIQDTIVDEIVIDGGSCLIIGVSVRGNIDVSNGDAVVMVENDVDGRIRVVNTGFVGVVGNRVANGNINVRESGQVQVLDNDTKIGSILVNQNSEADVNRNDANFNIRCRGNGRLDSFANSAGGLDNCGR